MTDTISVGGTMFDDAILSQPPTPQALVEVLGWKWCSDRKINAYSSPSTTSTVALHQRVGLWIADDDEGEIEFAAPSTLRDVVDLCRLLGIPCEVRR